MYIGVTNDLERRVFEHKNKLVKGFTEKYNIHKLVYFEETGDVNAALAREKEIKKWRREKGCASHEHEPAMDRIETFVAQKQDFSLWSK
jgi:predicted GIY-YIG superfamily endonuclease